MAEGTITRKDLITDDALQFGQEYAKNVQQAIDKNKELKESAKEMFEIYEKFSKVKDQSGFKESKEAEAIAFIKAKNAIKEREEALKSSERVKREVLKTDKALIKSEQDVAKVVKKTSVAWKEQDQAEKALIGTKRKIQLSSESTNRALIKERETLRGQNLEIKRNMTQMGRLTSIRDRARKSVQEFYAQVALGKPLTDRQQKELAQSRLEFDKYNKAINVIRHSTGQFQDQVGNYPKLFKSIGSATRQLIPILGVAGALRVGFGLVRDATQIIRDFDRQLIAVQKTTNLSVPQMKLFRKEVRDLGLDLKGVSIQGLLESSEVAGQLGIKGRKNILGFAKAIEILKISAKGIGDEAVADFAKFIEVSKDSAENADRLSSVVTDLGNNFATTEKEVISSSIEIQKGVQIYNVSAQAVLGLAAATTSLGIQDAAARTSIRKSLGVIQQAIFTGKNLEEVLSLTGLTQKELSEQFKNDTTGVFVKFLKGLNDMTEGGENTEVVLQKMKLAGDRVAPTLLSLASKHELTAKALERANEEYVTNTAALKEAELAAGSLDVKIEDLQDTWAGLILSVESGDGPISGFFKNLVGFVEGALKGMILFNEEFDGLLLRVGNDAVKDSFDFEIGFLATLTDEEAEAFAIRQLDRTDELIEKEKEKLKLLKEQKEARGESQGKGSKSLARGGASGRADLDDEIERSTIALATLEGKLKAYDQTLGITGESIKENSDNLKDNTGETIRNVAFLRTQISAHKAKIELAVNNDEVESINAIIKGYRDELNAILGVVAAAKKKSRAAQDAHNLEAQRIQQNIDTEKGITGNKDLEIGNRLNSSLFLYREEIKLLSLEKAFALKNAKGRADEILRINEKYQSDLTELGEQRAARDEALFVDAFGKAKARIEALKRAREQALNEELDARRTELNKTLGTPGLSNEARKAAVEKFEQDILDIKRKYAQETINLQIAQVQKELLVATLSFTQRKSLEEQLFALKMALNELETQNYLDNAAKKAAAEAKFQAFKSEQIRFASDNLAASLGLDSQNLQSLFEGLTEGFGEGLQGTLSAVQAVASVSSDILNSIFNSNIDNLDQQLQANEEYYNSQFELASGNQIQQDNIRVEQEKKRLELEKKKKKEQEKQAKFNKLAAVFQIGLNTATAITKAIAEFPITGGLPFTAIVAALGAIQIAAVLAKPIPKYAEGTEFHPGGPAEVSENRPEVIHEPGRAPYVQKGRATLNLPRGTKVYRSMDYYEQIQKAAMLANIDTQQDRLHDFDAVMSFDFHSKEVVDELKRNTQAIKDNGKPAPTKEPTDFNHELFRAQNTDWGS